MVMLYVANCTKQYQEVHFRLDFNDSNHPNQNSPAKKQTIPPGRQVALGGDLAHVSQADEIIKQLTAYGLVPASEIARLKAKAPYIYSRDTPVKPDQIRHVQNLNAGILMREGRLLREKAAIVVNETVADTVARQFAENGIDKEATQDVEVEFEQQDQSEAGEKRIEEGYRIDATSKPNQPTKAGRRRRN